MEGSAWFWHRALHKFWLIPWSLQCCLTALSGSESLSLTVDVALTLHWFWESWHQRQPIPSILQDHSHWNLYKIFSGTVNHSENVSSWTKLLILNAEKLVGLQVAYEATRPSGVDPGDLKQNLCISNLWNQVQEIVYFSLPLVSIKVEIHHAQAIQECCILKEKGKKHQQLKHQVWVFIFIKFKEDI